MNTPIGWGRTSPKGADLVMEVVSEDRTRDLVEKRREYAQARIPEYWLVDRRDRRITVLRLGRGRYSVHSEYGIGDRATSALLKGFGVDVAAVWAAAVRSSDE